MHKLSNESAWQATLASDYNHKRELLGIVIIKAAYAIDPESGALTPLKKKPAIEAADLHAGEPLKSALIAAGESSPPKIGGEFYILHATLTPPERQTTAAEAIVTLKQSDGSQFSKTLRIVGKRQWKGGLMLPSISQAEPLTAISLGYENAYGGSDDKAAPKEKHPTCLANYAGKGYMVNAKHCSGIALPQIETAPYISNPTARPQPAGFGPIPAFWEPRRSEQGAPDLEAAKRGGCPCGPDAKPTMHNAAPQDQRFARPWQGGEEITLTSILADLPYGKTCRITLPRNTPQVIVADKGKNTPLVCACDTFWIDAQKNHLHMLYRASYPMRTAHCDKGWIYLRDAQTTQTDHAQRKEEFA